MPQDPFPSPGPDDEEPASSPLPPAAEEGDGQEGDAEGMGQGLYLCLPAEQLTLAGFAQNGEADTMTPGPLLATVVDTVTGPEGGGLTGCSDDQLLGIVSAARRLQARAAWTELGATAAYATRHDGSRPADEFAPVELSFELALTPQSAKEQMRYAAAVAGRLPKTFAVLAAGRIHPVHLRIIEDETSILSDADAARADAILAEAAAGMTFGEVRSAAHKVVLRLDPEAVRKRKEAARGEAHVRRFREASGNAGLIARELPSDEVLASWQHVEQRALDLRAAGMPGTLQELRVRAYLDLLQERDSRDQPRPDGEPPAPPGSGHGQDGPGTGPDGSGGNGGSGGPGPGRGPGPAAGPGSGAAPGPSIAALVTITIPWTTYQGRAETPGEADGFGVLDGDDARDLAAAAARHPRTRWCITAINPDGTAAAHGCLPGRHPPPGTGPPGTPRGTGPPGSSLGIGLPGSVPVSKNPMAPVARGPCDHAHAEIGYHPSRGLAHLIRARNGRCTAPGCSRPAARCDLDHTVPWDQGGITCECGLAPLCRHHHRAKQAEGWRLDQPEPGVLTWRTPAGRAYATTPTEYTL